MSSLYKLFLRRRRQPVATYTVTINPTPADATVTINGVVRTSITVSEGTEVSYSVAKTGYTTKTGSLVPAGNVTVPVSLNAIQYTFTINPTPASATVTIDGVVRNSVTVDTGTTVSWSVSASGYYSQSGTQTMTGTTTKSVSLVSRTTSKAVSGLTNNWMKVMAKATNGNSYRLYVHNYVMPYTFTNGKIYTVKLTSGDNKISNGYMGYSSTGAAYTAAQDNNSNSGFPIVKTQKVIDTGSNNVLAANTTTSYTFTANANASYLHIICIGGIGGTVDPALKGNIVITDNS